jgi:hypothetical protein
MNYQLRYDLQTGELVDAEVLEYIESNVEAKEKETD